MNKKEIESLIECFEYVKKEVSEFKTEGHRIFMCIIISKFYDRKIGISAKNAINFLMKYKPKRKFEKGETVWFNLYRGCEDSEELKERGFYQYPNLERLKILNKILTDLKAML